jgi:uncharacterized phage-like protein YoqJ
MSNVKTLAFTGMRPHKLPFGFDESSPACLSLKIVIKDKLIELIEEENVRGFISGMAMGVDTICAEIVLELKERYNGVTLEAAVPHKEQSYLWPQRYRDRYRELLEKCDSVYLACEEFGDDCMERRNRYMVDKCDLVLAVWSGRAGGMGDTVKYAQEKNRPIIVIDPFSL